MSVIDDFINLQIPSVIFKDDCGYCYETMYNDDFTTSHCLNVCLHCFQSFCPEHTTLHRRVTGAGSNGCHDFYLKLSKVKKADVGEPTEKKLKLEINEKSEDEVYDSYWSLIKGTSSIADNQTQGLDPKVTNKVKNILQARSSNFQQMANSWQLEVKACEHVKSFTVSAGAAQDVGKNCADCDLGNNLWLCLHCGHLGCGRQQVGIEGHSHALAHFQQHPDHPLAVKLGSLSQSSADVYCYACDDEVHFDDSKVWVQALAHWNIDIGDRVAQEKTLMELQLEQNMNWDFQMVDSQGHDLQHLPSSAEFGCGLLNLGNSCYMNSVLQVLVNGGVFTWSLKELGDFPADVVYVSSNLKCQLLKLRNAMTVEPAKYSQGVKPTTFKRCIGGRHEEFSSGRQQDALEFFSYFTNLLDKRVFNETSSNPNDLFRFNVQDRLECTKCHSVKYSSQSYDYLQVPLSENDEPQELSERISSYFAGEDVSFKCPYCKEMVTAVKSSGFQSFPKTLVVSPTRIKLVNWMPVKNSQEVLLPGIETADTSTLQLGAFKSHGFDSEKERLLPENETNEFKPNVQCVADLLEMGFTENAATKALFYTNNSGMEDAMNWLFSHVEDPDLNEPAVLPTNTYEAEMYNPQELEDMVSMGLDPQLCRKALILNQGNVTASVEWVFNNLDDDGLIVKETPVKKEDQMYGFSDESLANYSLKAVICHKGSSVQSGHYVAFIKKQVGEQTKWVLYNDEKMVVAEDPMNIQELKKNGYIYFFNRC
ncbi:LAME_0H13718g1_1 [Lachancea meyersii CBS 8951]|uniref:Ubiquitin carboxyl-terminal hydrolase n=1 Tax=Lachancea meyersii CBS 8951 TaxID=1266667 RepID=A0A1G4KH84_9SACH|nr:LAME_0H13718g1_1 [Lachancea meyersii CBS 8951]